MKIKVLEKLYKITSEFLGQELVNIAFLKKNIKGQDILATELTFKDEVGVQKVMVFALDQKLTEGDYKEIVEKLCQ